MNSENVNIGFIDPGGMGIFNKLVSCNADLKTDFERYLKEYYYDGDFTYRMPFQDMDQIGDLILKKLHSNQTDFFQSFFTVVESILLDSDKKEKGLIIVGLFERLQKQTNSGITYSHLDKWLGPQSKKEWDELIEFWSQKIEKPDEN